MKRLTLPLISTALLAGLALAVTLAHAQPQGPSIPLETVIPVESGPPEGVPPVEVGPPDSVAHPGLGDPPAPLDHAADGQGSPAHAGPPDDVGPPAEPRPPEGARPPEEAQLPENAGPGRTISEAARQKAKDVAGEAAVTNPDGHVVPLSLVGFCRSQAPWMNDKGSACDELNAIFQELQGGSDNNVGDADDDRSTVKPAPPSQPGHRAARVGLEMARGLLGHVMALLVQA